MQIIFHEVYLKETHKTCQDNKFTNLSPAAKKALGMSGRMVSLSKTLGPATAIYNANIFDAKAKRIWYGDIVIGRDRENLLVLADQLGPLYILSEFKGSCLKGIPTRKYIQAVALVIVGTKVWIDDHYIQYMLHREKRFRPPSCHQTAAK